MNRRRRDGGEGALGVPNAFDALADLFMPGKARSAERFDGEHFDDSGAAGKSIEINEDADLAGAATDGESKSTEINEDVDLGGTARVGAVKSVVEMLIVGHLPVIASAWVHQYARSAVAGGAAVALVRMSGGDVRVEVFAGEGVRATPGRAQDAAGAMRAAGACGRVIVSCERTDEDRAAAAAGVGRVTMLIGADEASVVSAYARLKGLVDVLRGASVPAVAVALMGCGEAQAMNVHRRIADAARSFLGVEVEFGGWAERIGARAGVQSREVYAGSAGEHARVEDVIAAVGMHEHRDRPSTVDLGGAMRSESERDGASPGGTRMGEEGAGLIEFVQPSDEDTVDVEPSVSAERAPAERVKVNDAAGVCDAGADDEAMTGMDCAAVVGEGLSAIKARCPFARDVQIAVDGAGGLHALAFGEPASALERLTIARAWIGEHAELVGMTTERAVDARRSAVGHLLVSDARAVRRLLDADVKVHVVARVVTPGVVSRALN